MHDIVLQSIRMNTWGVPALWLGTKTLSEIARSFQLIAKQDDLLWTAVIFLGTAAVMAVLVRRQRTHIHAALLMFVLALVLLLTSAVPAALGLVLIAKSLHNAGLLMLGLALVKLGSVIIFDAVLRFTPFSPPQVLRDLMVAAGYLGVGFWLLSRNEVTLSSIVATSAVMSGVIVFSLQDSLSNILGGLVLQIDECFAVGDWVKIDQTAGRVKEITWRHVAIETRNWDTAIIPNSMLIKSQVLVMGQRSGQPLQQRRWVYFNVDFRVPPTEVMRVVTDALLAAPVEGSAVEPPPNCVLMDFKESYCLYAVRYWLADLAKDDPTDSLVRCRIYFALQQAGIPLSVPA